MKWLTNLRPVFAAVFGLALGLLVCKLAGESPWLVLTVMARGAFGSAYDFGMTLFYATPLILTGLSVALAFQAGLFNIGAEGQLTMGALACAIVGIVFKDVAWPMALPMGILASFVAGALWSAIAGWLKAWRGSHEVINTIMLNFIAAGLSSWATLYLFKNRVATFFTASAWAKPTARMRSNFFRRRRGAWARTRCRRSPRRI